jgi:dipeptidyl aminopeptidase/acylaminoacyl peptidase
MRLVMLAAALTISILAGSASAAFRGRNGRIAAASWDNRIFTVARDGSARRLIGPGTQPAWSPDATKLAYVSDDHRRVVVARADGSHPIAVSQARSGHRFIADPVWSPDGKALLFVDFYAGDWRYDEFIGVPWQRGGDIYRANADGSGELRLTADDGNYEPSWSRDAAQVVYTHFADDDDPDVYRISAVGGPARKLTDTTWDCCGGDSFAQPAWSPVANTIAYWSNSDAANNATGAGRIFTMDPAGGSERRLGSGSLDGQPRWSPDGTKLAFVHGETPGLSGWNSADGVFDVLNTTGALTRLAQAPAHIELGYSNALGAFVHPVPDDYTWSPDSGQLLYPDPHRFDRSIIVNVATAAVTYLPVSWDSRVPGRRVVDWQALPADSGPPVCQDLNRVVFNDSAIRIPLLCSDPHGRPLTLEIPHTDATPTQETYTSHLRHGTLSPITNGAVTYTPYRAYAGADAFSYQAHNDLDEHSNTATVTIDIRTRPQTSGVPRP